MASGKLKSLLKQFPFAYPTAIVRSCRDWIDKQNSKSGIYTGIRKHSFIQLEAAENHTHQLPTSQTLEHSEKFSHNAFYQTTPGYLFNLKDCYLYKKTGLVLSNRNALFQEFSHHFNVEPIPKFILKRPFHTFSVKVKEIDSTGAVLVSPKCYNYYHWLFDVLPRIKLYSSVMDQITYFYVSAAVPQKFVAMLPEFGVPLNKVVLIDNYEKLHFNNLYVASLPGSEGRSPKWVVAYLRAILLKSTQPIPATKKLYLKRGKVATRKILNEEAIITLLASTGFEITEPDKLEINEQIALMQQAAIIVSAHGAALSNLLFVNEGIKVIEIFSPDYFRTDCYFTLARLLNLDYRYIVGTKPENAGWGDIMVDEASLKAAIA